MLKLLPLILPAALTTPLVRKLVPSTLPDTDKRAPNIFPVALTLPGRFKSPVFAKT